MWQEIWLGIGFGLSVCMPFGPINILILNFSASNLKAAFAVGIGAAVCDTMLMFGFAFFSTQLSTGFNDILGIFGFFILAYMATGLLRAQASDLHSSDKAGLNYSKIFAKGFLLNALNPYVVAFWLGNAPQFNSSDYPYTYALSVCGTCFAWVIILSLVVSRFSRYLTPSLLRKINIFSGLVLLIFAFKILLNVSYFDPCIYYLKTIF